MKAALRSIVDAAALLFGWIAYAFTGRTPATSYQAFIRLFCRTGGRSNDAMTRAIVLLDRPLRMPAPKGALGISSPQDAVSAADRLRRLGYFVFPQPLPGDVCDRLLKFSLETRASIRPMSGASNTPTAVRRAIYDRHRPAAVRYDFDCNDVLDCADVQDLMANPSILAVAQSYLGSTPIADVTSMWWHTDFSDQPDAEAAQFFHFDMDRIKWLKFFIYLTDVGTHSGPHCFIEGSHRTHGIPGSLLAKGYSRLTDREVSEHYPSDRVVEFLAPRGTVIAEDSRGLHKGKEVRAGDRLMLQLQYSNSLFGGTYPDSGFGAIRSDALAGMLATHPAIYANYLGRSRTR